MEERGRWDPLIHGFQQQEQQEFREILYKIETSGEELGQEPKQSRGSQEPQQQKNKIKKPRERIQLGSYQSK